MKKTAVQKLIDYLEETYVLSEENAGNETRQEFKKALKEERENIETAFNEGGREAIFDKLASEYYSQTFKND